MVSRAQIILLAAQGTTNYKIAQTLKTTEDRVRRWRRRFSEGIARLAALEAQNDRAEVAEAIIKLLSDNERSGAPATFTAEEICHIIALACETPAAADCPVSHWSASDLTREVLKRALVQRISVRTVGRLLQQADLKPHKTEQWIHPPLDDSAEMTAQVQTVCAQYATAQERAEQGIHTISCDEKTGIQALERVITPMTPGHVERHDNEYERHGTQCLIANFDVARGTVLAPTISATRTEDDFATHIATTVAVDPQGAWIFICDNLNTHQSESLVRLVAKSCDITASLGVKGRAGMLRSMKSRAAFLSDSHHRIRFVYTPKHCSWLNQVELWFSILVRRLLKRLSVCSTDELRQKILDFIAYFNTTMAKPFKWTYKGRPLMA